MRKKQNTGVARLASVDPPARQCQRSVMVTNRYTHCRHYKIRPPAEPNLISFYWHQGGRQVRDGPCAIGPPVRAGLSWCRNHLLNTAREKQRGRPPAVVHQEALTAGTGEGIGSH